ncbi:MAG: STAS domain-containing protein [Thiogranum sp.]
MDILSSRIEGAFVVTPEGRLDTNNAPQAEKLLVENISAGEKRVVVDFSRTDYISSAGLRVILQAAKLVRRDGRVVLCNANEQIREVLEISGFLDMIAYSTSLKEAIRSVSE